MKTYPKNHNIKPIPKCEEVIQFVVEYFNARSQDIIEEISKLPIFTTKRSFLHK